MIFTASLPGVKTFLRPAQLSAATCGLVVSLLTAFCAHVGRLSAANAANAVRSHARHRAQLVRFLARLHWSRDWMLLASVADLLLQAETRRDGTWLFLLDQTYVGQQGQTTQNTFSRANYRPRVKKGKRKNKKYARRSCHGFVMGLLITPSGLRIPCCRSYYTEAYCQSQKKTYQTQIQLAAELIRKLTVPPDVAVVVLGDTAFEAKTIRAACRERNFHWVVPINPERVLGEPTPRPKVKSLAEGLSAEQFEAVRLVPDHGVWTAQRRPAACRVGPKAKARTFYVHPERRAVHNVGDVLLVFSTTQQPEVGRPTAVQKVLMTDAVTLSAAAVVELYDLRWQIELFFKELKSTLGMDEYRFRSFVKVENWVQACLVAFCYLEWYRAQQLAGEDVSEKEKKWWRWQRSHGLAAATVTRAEEADLSRLLQWSGTPGGRRKLRKCLREALAVERRRAS